MTADEKARWVAALRSGKYRQGRGVLGNAGTGYCCLAVYCLVNGISFDAAACGYTDTRGLSAAIRRYHAVDLVRMNDHLRLPFPVIADWIEANVPAEDPT